MLLKLFKAINLYGKYLNQYLGVSSSKALFVSIFISDWIEIQIISFANVIQKVSINFIQLFIVFKNWVRP